MIRNKLFATFAFLFYLVCCPAQTIDILVQEVFNNNLELKAMEVEYQAALEKVNQIQYIPDTEISAGVFVLPVETRVGAQSLRLSGMQAFPQFKAINQKQSLARSKADVVHQKLLIKKQQLNYQVRKALLNWYQLDQAQLILNKNINILKTLEQIVLVKTETGKAAATDVLLLQIKIKGLQQELLLLENQKQFPKIEIQKLLPREIDFSLNILDNLVFENLVYQLDSLEQILIEQHPKIHLLNLKQEVSRQSILLNQTNQKSVFGAGIDYIMVDKRDAAIENNGQDIVQLKAMVRIPIYKKHYKAKDREEQLLINALDIRKEKTIDDYLVAISTAFAKHESTRLEKELFEQQISLTQTAIEILQTNYSASGQRFDELIKLVNDLNTYDLKLLEVIVKSHLSKLEIESLLYPGHF